MGEETVTSICGICPGGCGVNVKLIDGKEPAFDAIADGSYPVSRPLFFYVKKAHVGTIPGMQEYVAEFVSDKATGEYGYLTERGLIPMPEGERGQFAYDAKSMTPLKM